jgi:hypothetical protein
MSNKSAILTVFNNHFTEFIDDVVNIFPNDVDLLAMKNSFILIRKANPRMFVTVFYNNVYSKYYTQIEKGEIDFFIEKDYKDDLTNNDHFNKIIESINRLRDPIRKMNDSDKQKTIKYLQNLCKLSHTYMN